MPGFGRRGKTDLLALSFSAHDIVSHKFGNEFEEELDTLLADVLGIKLPDAVGVSRVQTLK